MSAKITATTAQQKVILQYDRWATFGPRGTLLDVDMDFYLLKDILNDERNTHPENTKICSDYEQSCYQITDLLVCWLGKPEPDKLTVADGICPVLNYSRYLTSGEIKTPEK